MIGGGREGAGAGLDVTDDAGEPLHHLQERVAQGIATRAWLDQGAEIALGHAGGGTRHRRCGARRARHGAEQLSHFVGGVGFDAHGRVAVGQPLGDFHRPAEGFHEPANDEHRQQAEQAQREQRDPGGPADGADRLLPRGHERRSDTRPLVRGGRVDPRLQLDVACPHLLEGATQRTGRVARDHALARAPRQIVVAVELAPQRRQLGSLEEGIATRAARLAEQARE